MPVYSHRPTTNPKLALGTTRSMRPSALADVRTSPSRLITSSTSVLPTSSIMHSGGQPYHQNVTGTSTTKSPVLFSLDETMSFRTDVALDINLALPFAIVRLEAVNILSQVIYSVTNKNVIENEFYNDLELLVTVLTKVFVDVIT